MAEVRPHVYLGTPDQYRQTLRARGLSGRIQTAFIERLNSLAPPARAGVTIRRSSAGLARRSWSVPHSLNELALHFDGWRASYPFARPHGNLRQVIGGQPSRPRYRPRTPAQAAAFTNHRWTVPE